MEADMTAGRRKPRPAPTGIAAVDLARVAAKNRTISNRAILRELRGNEREANAMADAWIAAGLIGPGRKLTAKGIEMMKDAA
jgi:hypothetical protein